MSAGAAAAAMAAALGVVGLAEALPGPGRPDEIAGPRRAPPARRAGAARGARTILALAALGGLVRRLSRRPRPEHVPAGLGGRIAAAGSPAGLGPRELMAAKLAGAAAGAALALVLAAPAPGRLGALVALAGPTAGFLAPDWWLLRRARERARRVRRDLPALLDLLRVSIEAGLAPVAALAAVGERAGGPLGRDWRAVGREVGLGVPLAEALARSAARLPLPEVRALGAALERAARHGAPLSETLEAQAREARLALRRRIEEEAARAGPKIQLVVALLLVPSVLLLVAAALAAALLGGGGLPIAS